MSTLGACALCAMVVTAAFTPFSHGVELMPIYDLVSGELSLDLVESSIPKRFSVVFQCQHGQFVIDGEPVYRAMLPLVGKEVSIAYREEYRVVYKENDNGERVAVERTLIDYDFLYAKPMGSIPEGSL